VIERIARLACSVVLAVGVAGCGGGSTGPDGDDPTGGRIYVDASYAGVEEGTQEHPYDTVEEGIAAAERGDTVVLAAGTYAGTNDIEVPRAMCIVGSGAGSTMVSTRFIVTAPADTLAVTVKRLKCESVTFYGNGRPGGNAGAEARLPPRIEYAPIVVDSCDVGHTFVGYPPDHDYTIERSAVDSITFAHGASDHGTHTIRDCAIAGSVEFAHGQGPIVTVVEGCTVGGTIRIVCGQGHTFTIADNTVNGIYDSSGACFTTISGNTLPSGSIIDRSGGWGPLESEIIENNVIQNGVIENASGCATVRYNTVNAPSGAVGIDFYCGAPANLVGNTVTLPPASGPVGEPWEWETDIGINARCGQGVISGNTVTGGSVGIVDRSGVSELSDNVVSGAYFGIFGVYGLGKTVSGNSVTGCVSDGIVVSDAYTPPHPYGPFEGNTVTDNGGAGFRLKRAADLGGGAWGSTGGNTITGNAGYDLVVEVPADSAAVIFAEGNVWDHSSEADIDAHDVWDANDDPALSDVDFLPLGGGR